MTELVNNLFSFGTWVRRRRKALDLTQAALGDCVGCAEVTIRKLEADAFRPSREIAERLASCLELSPDDSVLFLQVARAERSVDHLPATLTATSQMSAATEGAVYPIHIPLDTIPHPAPLPPGSRMLLSRNPLFVGRQEQLCTLAHALAAEEGTSIGQLAIVAATGLGGIGKTQLACEFIHRYGHFFPGGVFWISFSTPTAIPGEIAACGGSGGMQLSPEFGTLPLAEQVQRVLAAWAQPIPRLLVFDNCEDEALLEQWRPKHGGCRVLITSRRHHWNHWLGVQVIPLEVLSRQDSLRLLRTFRPDLRVDDPDLDAIAAVLGDLPLALHLAGSFLARYRHTLTPAQYLQRIQVATLLDDHSLRSVGLSPTKHVQHVARTFEQSYEQLNPADPTDALALTLIAHATCFAPGEPLPRWLLLRTLDMPDASADTALLPEDALRRLIDLGLLESGDAGVLCLHRLLVAFVRAMGVHGAAQAAVEATILAVADDLNNLDHPGPLLPIQPHLRWLVDAAQPRADPGTAGLCHALGYHLRLLGVYEEAQRHLEQALAIQERVLGPEHPDTARSLNSLGAVRYGQGHYAAAQAYVEQALAMRERVLGLEHPDTARSLNSLGAVLHAQGRYEAAQRALEQAVAIYQQVLGIEHPDTGRSLTNLGMVLHAQGHYAAAQSYLEQTLALHFQLLGADHPETAINLNELGEVQYAQGHYAAAQRYLEQALAIQERVLGPQHPDTARSLRGLGKVFQAHGNNAQAICHLERALTILVERLGPNHPDTAQTHMALMACTGAMEACEQPTDGGSSASVDRRERRDE